MLRNEKRRSTTGLYFLIVYRVPETSTILIPCFRKGEKGKKVRYSLVALQRLERTIGNADRRNPDGTPNAALALSVTTDCEKAQKPPNPMSPASNIFFIFHLRHFLKFGYPSLTFKPSLPGSCPNYAIFLAFSSLCPLSVASVFLHLIWFFWNGNQYKWNSWKS